MDKRRLAGTDLDVSVICYGPMRLAQSPDDPDLGQHLAAMHAALDRGVNFIHSSYEYGVRWMMHEVLKDHPKRHDLLHVIKAPVPDWDDADFDPVKFEARIDEALRDLCTDRIALVQWMWRCRPHDEATRLTRLSAIKDSLTETVLRLQEKGKLGHLGCFPYFPESAAAAMNDPAQRVLIAYYNPLETEMSQVIDKLQADGRGFLAIRPLYEGVLTDRYPTQAAVPAGHRLAAAKYADAFAFRAALAEAVPEAATGMTRFAVRFPLMSPHCASVIVGLSTAAQVAQICDMAQGVAADPDTVACVRALSQQSPI
ncbi:aldo/keto reductase [Pseudotabrizicola sediminis]|uniref:Aldo/keto reductase n=1 Tax=Pseudotabrizicola sediminis TaxID=2486418 RepID=A0ABY2KLK5_9RHOB|nr:aldo/keto reductase [Pseudotabrizicola sediminis]TGD41746.1 aldo/keto reductase [Pseudotabrizicola sediminis]